MLICHHIQARRSIRIENSEADTLVGRDFPGSHESLESISPGCDQNSLRGVMIVGIVHSLEMQLERSCPLVMHVPIETGFHAGHPFDTPIEHCARGSQLEAAVEHPI